MAFVTRLISLPLSFGTSVVVPSRSGGPKCGALPGAIDIPALTDAVSLLRASVSDAVGKSSCGPSGTTSCRPGGAVGGTWGVADGESREDECSLGRERLVSALRQSGVSMMMGSERTGDKQGGSIDAAVDENHDLDSAVDAALSIVWPACVTRGALSSALLQPSRLAVCLGLRLLETLGTRISALVSGVAGVGVVGGSREGPWGEDQVSADEVLSDLMWARRLRLEVKMRSVRDETRS
jgi:hypothetical protein